MAGSDKADFNSSKVRYKRKMKLNKYERDVIFQFLQGTVQTRANAGTGEKQDTISIPPRYGTNSRLRPLRRTS